MLRGCPRRRRIGTRSGRGEMSANPRFRSWTRRTRISVMVLGWFVVLISLGMPGCERRSLTEGVWRPHTVWECAVIPTALAPAGAIEQVDRLFEGGAGWNDIGKVAKNVSVIIAIFGGLLVVVASPFLLRIKRGCPWLIALLPMSSWIIPVSQPASNAWWEARNAYGIYVYCLGFSFISLALFTLPPLFAGNRGEATTDAHTKNPR